ncbi:Long-chain fatty acid transport protein 2 [Exophiala dermatitidis]
MATVAATAAAAAAGLFYADRKLGVSRDISQYRLEQSFAKRFPEFVGKLGPQSPHLYRMLELADPTAEAIWFEGRSWNYRAMKQQVDELAVGLHETLQVKNGDIVAVFMTNSPEMVFTVYALTRLGAAPALINNALRDETLLHCVRLPSSKLILTTPDLAVHAATAAKLLDNQGVVKTVSLNLGSFRPTTVLHEDSNNNNILDFPLPDHTRPQPPVLPPIPPKSLSSVAALIYTSGTTGKPKACRVKNALICGVSLRTSIDDTDPQKYLANLRIYSCMPIFHGTTFFTGLCYSVANNGCFCVGRRFSARNYWREVHESRATRILYVGELCRFLLATPATRYDRDHMVLVAAGNGLQKDVWVAFQERFRVDEVREFYRSTEGLVKFDNIHRRGRPGAGKVGYLGVLRKKFLEKDQFIVKFDYESEMPLRDPKTGFCQVADRGEPGEAIARIHNLDTYTDYHANRDATEQKLLRNVFAPGDLWQRSGDLLVQEPDGWVKFVDRIGDTYRWMGENVSAGEVRALISELPGVRDVVVVGRRLDRYDGQVGTALVVLDTSSTSTGEKTAQVSSADAKTEQQVDAEEKGLVAVTSGDGDKEAKFMASLYKALRAKGLPRYAIPRLVMVRTDGLIDVGDTFKHAKMVVKNIDWAGKSSSTGNGGSRYYLDLEEERFKPLDQGAWASIELGRAKL